MPEKVRRHFLKDREATQLLNAFSNKLKIDVKQLLGSKQSLESIETPTGTIFSIDKKPLIAIINGELVPTLLFEEALRFLPKIIINMGAVPHICNGADVMAPGVVRIEKDFDTDDYVVVTDERYNKPIAITTSLIDSKKARDKKQGKIAKNIHYVGDKLWSQIKRI